MTTGAIRRAKLQSNRHHQQTNTQFFLQAGCRGGGSGGSRHSNFLYLGEHPTPSEGDVENLAADQMMKGR